MVYTDAIDKTTLEPKKSLDDLYIIGFVFFLIVMLLLLTTYLALKEYYYDSDSLPINTLSIKGDLNDQEISYISNSLATSGLLRNFIKMDVNEIQEAVGKISWVESVAVRKQWPAYLHLAIVKKQPVARWNGNQQLLSTKLGIYDAPEGEDYNSLVLLVGLEYKAKDIYQNYQSFRELLAQVGCGITKVVLTNRQSWELYLDNGIKLIVGRENIEANEMEDQDVVLQRVERFTKIYPNIRKNFARISYIDLRYDSGMAIGWKKDQIELDPKNI